MNAFPDAASLSDEPALSGHLWVQELPTGGAIRVQVEETGLLELSTPERAFDPGSEAPLPYRRTRQFLQTTLDVGALRAATDDPSSVALLGLATRYEGVDYDWERLAPFVGVDVWSDERDGFLSPDAAAAAFERLGLAALPAVETEVPAEYADLERYTDPSEMPASAWSDGPAAGVLVRDKSGGRARSWHPPADRPEPLDVSPEILVDRFVTDERIRRTVAVLGTDDPGVEPVFERVLADVAREAYASLFREDELVVDERAFRTAVAERVRRELGK